MIEFIKKDNSLYYSLENEIIELKPWGRNGIRVRSTQSREIKQDWISALINQGDNQASIEFISGEASLKNGEIKARINFRGELSFINVNSPLTESGCREKYRRLVSLA